MRHRIQDKKFNRDSNQRKALFMGLLRNLTVQGSIVTTMARAKAVKRLADRMVTTASANDVAARRKLHHTFGKRDVVNKLVDVVAPAMSDRKSGFVRVTAMGNRRGDNTPMATLEFVNQAGIRGQLTKTKEATPKVKSEKKALPAKTEVKEKVAKPAAKKTAAKKVETKSAQGKK